MMMWLTNVIVLLGLHCFTTSFGLPHQFPPIDDDAPSNDYFGGGAAPPPPPPAAAATGDFNIDMDKYISGLDANIERADEEKLLLMGNYLAELLMMPSNDKGLPLLYIEDTHAEDDEDNNGQPQFTLSPIKRARYYRKYPWKRQNAKQTYDAENRYLCQPSKDDVYRLLVALHESRQGSGGRNINFCNRKRPAKAIFTNIRFLG